MIRKNKWSIWLGCLLFGCALMAENDTPVEALPLRLSGSDFIGGLIKEISSEFPGVELALQGSYLAERDLKEGKSSAALLFVQDDKEFGEDWVVLKWGYLTMLVAVVESNPIPELSINQLGGIFLTGRDDTISRWGELGLSGVWESRAVAPMLYQDSQHLFPGLFRALFPNGSEFRANLRRFRNVQEAVTEAARQNSSIVALPYGSELSGLKVLPLAGRSNPVAYLATGENLESGRYPLAIPVKLVYHRSRAKELAPLFRALYAEETLEKLPAIGLCPISEATRMRYQLNFEFME